MANANPAGDSGNERRALDDLKVRVDETAKSSDAFLEQQKLVFAEAQKKVDDLIANAGKRFDDLSASFAAQETAEVAKKWTIAYAHKARTARCSAHWYEVWFVLAVGLALGLAGCNWYVLHGQVKTFSDLLNVGAVTLISSLPFYALLVWLAYSAKRRVTENSRLAEAYEHKMLFGKSMIGVWRQVRSVEHIDSEGGKKLKTQFLEALIRTYEKDVSDSKTPPSNEMPIGEAADGVSKVIGSVSSLMPWNKG